MPSLLERFLDKLFEYQEIRDGCEAATRTDGPVYLKRYYLVRREEEKTAYVHKRPRFNLTWHRSTDGIQIYLHKICRSDVDLELHDHPWHFLSVLLRGGYDEETERLGVRRRVWPVLFRRAAHRHRVLLIDGRPAWTLVFTSSKKRSWGFYRDGVFIPWRWFIARKCEGDRVA